MPPDAPANDREFDDRISGVHRRVMDKVFQHPLTHNLTLREVISLLEHIGAAEPRHNGDVLLRLGAEHLSLKRMRGKDLAATEVMEVRHFLMRCGWSDKSSDRSSEKAPVPASQARPEPIADLMIVIDHAGARLYPLAADSPTMAAHETHHLHRPHIDRKHHDADRAENYPADRHFFAAVATDIPAEGRIVLVSHGKGDSNEAGHLIAYLDQHAPAIAARIVANLVADLSHITAPQLVALAREAVGTAPVKPLGAAG